MLPPLVSIILPVWNPKPLWLNAAIDSAFHEGRCRIELILVDDGSDQPPDVWLSAHNIERVHVTSIRHSGVSRARNVGLELCNGDFIRFLDADDVILRESTSALLDLGGGHADIVPYGSTILCNTQLTPIAPIRSRLNGCIHLQTALGHFHCTLPALLIPRKVISQSHKFDERMIVQGDWDFVLRLSESAEFRSTQHPVYLYRRHEQSLTASGERKREATESTVLIIKGYLKRHPELRGTRAERHVRAYAQFLISKFDNPGSSLRTSRFWRAVASDPIRGAIIACARTRAVMSRALKSELRALSLPSKGTPTKTSR
jgi:glycosyltransferase involved in cell wall biosynthesis